MLLARPVLLAIGACAAAIGCRPQADRIERASERAQPHLESYRRFERWAQRAVSAPSAPFATDALGDLVFAPIRSAPEVVGAWVELAGDRPLTLAMRASAPLPRTASWVALRTPAIGALRVADAERCPTTGAAAAPAEPRPCVLISRAERSAGAQAVSVTMAFAREPP